VEPVISEDGLQIQEGSGDKEREGADVDGLEENVHTLSLLNAGDQVEHLAGALCDTYYLTVDPNNKMYNAWWKITERTREHWRAQAALLIEMGVTVNVINTDNPTDRDRKRRRPFTRSGSHRRW
jgi:hypothetical protein